MKVLDAIRNHSSRGDSHGEEASSPDAAELPISGYNRLGTKEVGAQLSELSQVELDAVESYERSHKDRPEVLNKLRYMHTSEPLPGYDALTIEEIVQALAGADAETVKAVRDYERKFRHRFKVMDEAARVLPTAPASAGEDRAREEKDTRVREGIAGRAKTADRLASAPEGQQGRDAPGPSG